MQILLYLTTTGKYTVLLPVMSLISLLPDAQKFPKFYPMLVSFQSSLLLSLWFDTLKKIFFLLSSQYLVACPQIFPMASSSPLTLLLELSLDFQNFILQNPIQVSPSS